MKKSSTVAKITAVTDSDCSPYQQEQKSSKLILVMLYAVGPTSDLTSFDGVDEQIYKAFTYSEKKLPSISANGSKKSVPESIICLYHFSVF
jgi:hypothetical protein